MHPFPYTSDLVPLATSALLAIKSDRLAIGPRAACNAILAGYKVAVARGGRPFVLAERHGWLGDIARRELKNAKQFWKDIEELPVAPAGLPEAVRRTVESTLPDPGMEYRVLRRVAGAGGLGCPRYVAAAHWHGGLVAREAKAMPPSAQIWAGSTQAAPGSHAQRLAGNAARARDPLLQFAPGWRVRRLAPDCCKLDLGDLPGQRDERRLLAAMGKETANIHCGSPEALPAVIRHLDDLHDGWLLGAARTMTQAVRQDWRAWRARQRTYPEPRA